MSFGFSSSFVEPLFASAIVFIVPVIYFPIIFFRCKFSFNDFQ